MQANILILPPPHTSAPISQVQEKTLSLQHAPSKFPLLPCTQLVLGALLSPQPQLPGDGHTGGSC